MDEFAMTTMSAADKVKFLYEKRGEKLDGYLKGFIATMYKRVQDKQKYVYFSHNERNFIDRAYDRLR